MRLINPFLILLFMLSVFGGCIKEDMSDCPPVGNVLLTFSYRGDTDDPAMFARTIESVTLYCYAADGTLVKTQTVDKSALEVMQGTSLHLVAGDYTIIAWGNATDGTTEVLGNTLAAGLVHHPNFIAGTDIPGNDHLYYGEYHITVPETTEENVSGDIPFRGAHVNMEVYVSGVGFEDDPATWARVEVTSLMPQYTMQMGEAQPFATTYHPVVSWDTENGVTAACFQTLRFADDNSIVVNIKRQDGTLIYTVNLKEFMQANSITVDGKNEATVSLLVKFYDAQFSISIPDWNNSSVTPDI